MVEGLGEAAALADAAAGLKPGELSEPVETRRGIVIFTVAEVQQAGEAALAKEKEEYSKRVVASKKIAALEKWLRALETEKGNVVLIDFGDYEKYYR
jgi:parvulin-like peptidyl-prolyl isomerase